jgi:hypothetical protein
MGLSPSEIGKSFFARPLAERYGSPAV